MPVRHHGLTRAGSAVTATALALTGGVAVSLLAPASATAAPAAVVIPAPGAGVDGEVELLAGSHLGALYQEEGTSGYVWSRTGKVVTALDGVPAESIVPMYDYDNRVAYTTVGDDGRTTIVLLDLDDSTSRTMTLPAGYSKPQMSGGFVLVSAELEDGSHEYRIVRTTTSGSMYEVPVRLPAGASAEAEPEILARDNAEFVVRYQQDGRAAYGIVDGVDGSVQALQVTGPANSFRLTSAWVSWFTREGEDGIRLRARSSPGGTPGIRPVTTQSPDSEVTSFVVGDNLLWYEGSGGTLHKQSLDGEPAGTALADVEQIMQTGDAVTAVGRVTADGTRAILHLSQDGTGAVFVNTLHVVPPVRHYGTVGALSLDRGTVRFLNTLRGTPTLHSQDVGTAMAPADGSALTATAPSPGTGLGRFADGGDEGLAQLTTDPATGKDVLTTADDPAGDIALPATGGRILDVSPQYVLYAGSGGTGTQYVVDIAAGEVVREQEAQAAALDHATLWTPSTTGGSVVATSLRTGEVLRTVDAAPGCTPDDLRTNGTLLYWSCAGLHKAGIKKLDGTGQAYPAPVGEVLLGDGFYAYLDPATRSIQSVEIANDVTEPLGEITGVAATEAFDNRGFTWSVDRRSNKIAYLGSSDNAVHVVSAHTYTWLASRLSVPDSTVPAAFAADGGAARWTGRWWLSKPAASWQLTLRSDATGAVPRTWQGGPARSAVDVSWDGRSQAGALVPNGAYTWTLTAAPADGAEAMAPLSGSLKVTGAAAVRRDHAGLDGIGDLVTLNSAGSMTIQQGNGTGALAGKVSGSGWATSVTAVPFGDLNGDRCNEVLVRFAGGTLRAYRPACGKAVTPSTAYTSLGTGFQQYNVLTSPGDVTGDGRADLIARNSSTGATYLYRATSSGKLSARVKLYADWSGYKKIVGAGDLNGDGRGDLLAQDRSNELWRYNGTGSGTFTTRVKVFDNWGSAYNAVVGTGDLTGDGKSDLAARDTAGVLWRLGGNGRGSFGSRTKIATGWGGYQGVF
ncbi:FG-GAP-like repeat-containing protein [Streptomyces sp. NPDC087903]|uniref:FG-GAP-like repeat-containing protein n=1 Tax=Streptomyces sp. NPDC087903 TaxID=3365819 RepID=UPI003826AF6B